MKVWEKSVLFYLGGSAYMALEVCWRGWSHGSMFLAGGTAFLLIGRIGQTLPRVPRAVRAILGATAITLVELSAGLICNRSYAVWDYRDRPGNVLGQICPLYTLLWIPVALLADVLYCHAAHLIRVRTRA